MAIGGIPAYGAGQGGYDTGATYNALADASRNAQSTAAQSAKTGSPQDAQKAKQAANKEQEAAQTAAMVEEKRNGSVMALLR
ncbi:hypothetical protein [Paraburkholderia rhizosphaerae]|uniref:Uncharacterized protein n=1 Tax=Paraburkholderia rhizosphaerae TaxID=480658 RepID=A0A4V3HFK7_9BURK|nr:hypothetical protein [Paraburkholderia rhizosphaerae]TDY53575.1 hypothetical protein BX592_103388 [Paraburkholderia rhizosphaerae]